MTQEEAIKVIKDNWPDGRVQLQEALETLIPELKESEDKKIWKEIVEYIKIQQRIIKDEGHIQQANDIEKWLTWLEKQGEQKPVQDVDEQIETIAMHLDNCGNTAMAEILRSCDLHPQKPTWNGEVDLEKELSLEDYKGFFEKHPDLSDDWGFDEAWLFANYFFELGLKSMKGE